MAKLPRRKLASIRAERWSVVLGTEGNGGPVSGSAYIPCGPLMLSREGFVLPTC